MNLVGLIINIEAMKSDIEDIVNAILYELNKSIMTPPK